MYLLATGDFPFDISFDERTHKVSHYGELKPFEGQCSKELYGLIEGLLSRYQGDRPSIKEIISEFEWLKNPQDIRVITETNRLFNNHIDLFPGLGN